MTDLERALSRCPHAEHCSGCDLLGATDEEHDRAKEGLVARAFSGPRALPLAPLTRAEPSFGYRTRAKLVVAGDAIGLYRRGSHEVVDTRGCAVLDPGLEGLLEELRALPLARAGVVGLDLRRVDDGAFLTLLVEGRTPELDALVGDLGARIEEAPHASTRRPDAPLPLIGLFVSERPAGSVTLLGGPHELRAGRAEARHRLASDLPFQLAAPGAFVQAHAAGAAALYRAVERGVAETGSSLDVVELHAGSGTLALLLARAGHRVRAVESFAPAIERLARAAREQTLAVEGHAEDALGWLRRVGPFDVALVNPPRRGLEPELRSALAERARRLVVYVSCEPKTLARDLGHFARLGFAAERLHPFDLMPQTAIVETLAFLRPAPPPLPDVLHDDEELLVVVKEPHEPTHPQGDGRASLLDRVRRLPGATLAVPVHRLDAGTSGVCLFAKRPEFVARLAEALAAGEKTYLAWVKGIPNKSGKIQKDVLEGRAKRPAKTRYRRVDLRHGHALVEVHPEQGRRHQIRQHFRGIGHPLLGDARYGDDRTNRHFFAKRGLDRPALHCARIALGAPRAGLVFEAPLADDLRAAME